MTTVSLERIQTASPVSANFRPKAHGNTGNGELVHLLRTGEALKALKTEAVRLPILRLTDRQLCDVELLLNGGFSPLTGFLNKDAYESVVENLHLPDGTLWPMPITLDVSEKDAATYPVGSRVALLDHEMNLIAVLTVESSWVPNKEHEAQKVFGTTERLHPAVAYLFNQAGSHYLGGTLEGVQLPVHYDFCELRLTPVELRARIEQLNWTRVVAFQTRNPMHRSHRELTVRAAHEARANLVVHPVVGMTKPGDVDHYTRVRCYQQVLAKYPPGLALLSLLPIAMRMGGPREAVWHAIIRKNYGMTHFIVGRDHAGPGNNSEGKPFYGLYEAQELAVKYQAEIGLQIMKYNAVVYVEDTGEYVQDHEVPAGSRALEISGTELRRRLFKGLPIPEWFTFPEVAEVLRQSYPARTTQGFTVFFTGLSGAGKSTIANALMISLLQDGSRPVSLLDGDEVRTHLSSELGFSKEHRDLNIRRISYVASLITKSRGVAITAAIAPYRAARDGARAMIAPHGGFVEVHISTSLEVCESRDRKGLYAKAKQGLIKGFTGIDDPYEPPLAPELSIDTATVSVKQAVHEIIMYLHKEGFLDTAAEPAIAGGSGTSSTA